MRTTGSQSFNTEAALGGPPFNVAVALAALGETTGFYGGLSRDRFGDLLAARLGLQSAACGLIASRVFLPSKRGCEALRGGCLVADMHTSRRYRAPAAEVTAALCARAIPLPDAGP